MPKRLALITTFSCIAEVHRQTLRRLFGEEIEITRYTYDQGNLTGPIAADLFVISIYQVYLNVRRFLPPGARTVIINTTLTEEQYQQVAAVPPGTAVLLVNYCVEMTMDTLSLFNQLGLNHLAYVPWYPGAEPGSRPRLAVTPGEGRHVPPYVEEVVDIGDRVMDARTILDIAGALGLEHLLKEERFLAHFRSLRTSPGSVRSLLARTKVLESQLSGLLDVLDDGILVVEDTGIAYAGNRKARELLGQGRDLAGMRAVDLLPGIPFGKVLAEGAVVDYTLVKVQARDLSVKVVPVAAGGETLGALALVDSFEEKEKNQQSLRSQLLGKGHRGRYAFEDILGQDPAFREVKDQARKKARSDASVLIIGETGTGKELFAHAIHLASRREAQQFVTVNCAALPESLLESELFGYEEGAFTGARKGGKPGLFELAHKGTIFLDEIGELDLALQARLLRVLEGRDVMRIGGDRRIYVDIRIISATNKDLRKLVDTGRFRRDLYYRLNVLPVQVPPLRRRPDDITLLFEHFRSQSGARFRLGPGVAERLRAYPWPGNVRELKNLVEYLAALDQAVVGPEDLAPVLQVAEPAPRPVAGQPLAGLQGPDLDHGRFLLECLHDSWLRKVRLGRRGLCRRAQDQDLFLTEAQVRTLLERMERAGLVRMANGRAGTVITEEGIAALHRLAGAGAGLPGAAAAAFS